MALFNNAIWGGALLSGALFGGEVALKSNGAGGPAPKERAPTYWSWAGDKFLYADTLSAIEGAIKANPTSPVLSVAKNTVRLPAPPKNSVFMGLYILDSVKFADNAREKIKLAHHRDEVAVILMSLGIVDSYNLVVL